MPSRTVKALHPDSPRATTWVGPMLNQSGMGEEMRGFVLGLRERGRPIAAQAFHVSQVFVDALSPAMRKDLEAAVNQPQTEHPVCVLHSAVGYLLRIEGVPYQIVRTMFETDSLPDGVAEQLNQMDEIWVASNFNVETFRHAGVTVPIHVVPSGVDADIFRPDVTPLPIEGLKGTVFLSVFGWADRKGWDILLEAWSKAFGPDDDVTLLLRTYPADHFHGAEFGEEINRRIDDYLRSIGSDRSKVANIVVAAEHLGDDEMPGLYAAGDAFVLPTRGEGWGRPYIEAMSAGLPVIGTRWGSQLDFLNDDNALLIDIDGVEPVAGEDQVVFRGQRWARPSTAHLTELLKRAANNPDELSRLGKQARADVEREWTWQACCEKADALLDKAHDAARPPRQALASAPAVRWIGDQWSVHSLAIVNREICSRLAQQQRVNLETLSFEDNPALAKSPSMAALAATAGPVLGGPPQIVVRHQWPPDWSAPEEGVWVLMQPWEFGGLPDSWLPALEKEIDEVWCYTSYVRDVYIKSGIPAERVKVVPLGVNTEIYRPEGPRYPLRTRKQFKILFVGGAIGRKGIDVLFDAYLAAFKPTDDVCLVLKTAGANSFYQGQAQDEAIKQMAADPNLPDIEIIDAELAPEELAALFRSCDALAHPYRGEGFGLPVAEALASGLPVMVTDKGACSDFCDDDVAFMIPSKVVPLTDTNFGPSKTGYSWAEADRAALAQVMRQVYEDPSSAQARAERGRARIAADFSWDRSVSTIVERCEALARITPRRTENPAQSGTQKRNVMPEDTNKSQSDPRAEAVATGRQRAEDMFNAGDAGAAAQLLLGLQQRFPDDPGILSDLGVVVAQLGETTDALVLFDSALEINPNDEGADDNHQALMKLLEGGSEEAKEVARAHQSVCTRRADRSQPPLRLNVGAGDDRREGYVSVDLRTDAGVDVVADVRELPYDDGTVDEVLAFDVLEHFWKDQTQIILAEWKRVLRVGGLLQLKVPNLLKLAGRLDSQFHEITVENIYGGHRWGPEGAWDTHHWGWTPRTLQTDLEKAGFEVQSNDEDWNMTVRAIRR